MLSRTLAVAQEQGYRSGVVTFDVHPNEVLQRVPQRYLTTLDERIALIAEAGVDLVLLLRGTPELLDMEAADFVAALIKYLNCRAIVVGANFRFGRGGMGDIEALTRLAAPFGTQVIALELLANIGLPVSSSRIREELDSGRVDRAAALLGRPVSVRGQLHRGVHGLWVVSVASNLMLPAPGAYAGQISMVSAGEESPSMSILIVVPSSMMGGSWLRVVPSLAGFRSSREGEWIHLMFDNWSRIGDPPVQGSMSTRFRSQRSDAWTPKHGPRPPTNY